jgi:selenide, water dikinase
VPVLSYAREYAAMGLVPAGSHANRRFCENHLTVDARVGQLEVDLLSDAQTSGGLLIAVAENQQNILMDRLQNSGVIEAAVIGAVTGAGIGKIRVQP